MALYIVFIDALLKSHVMPIDNCLIRIQAILYGNKKCVVIIHKKTSIHSFWPGRCTIVNKWSLIFSE